MTFAVEGASPADRAAIRSLLDVFALPVADIEDAPIQFWVARDRGRVVGTVGLERYGACGLIRSLVVESDGQKRGIGRALIETLEREAQAGEVAVLVVLTQTARKYFHRLGYVDTDRADVPEVARQSAQFKTLCPASAACLSKSLVPPRAAGA